MGPPQHLPQIWQGVRLEMQLRQEEAVVTRRQLPAAREASAS